MKKFKCEVCKTSVCKEDLKSLKYVLKPNIGSDIFIFRLQTHRSKDSVSIIHTRLDDHVCKDCQIRAMKEFIKKYDREG